MNAFWNSVVTWSADPVAFSVFGFDVRWYGLVYALGALFALWLVPRLLAFGSPLDGKYEKKKLEDIILYAFLWGVVGGRVGHMVGYDFATLAAEPLQLFRIWKGGMSIHGGIAGTVIYLLWVSRKNKFSFWALADALVLPLAIALSFGRYANWLNGEIIGAATNQPWGVIFPHIDTIARHPVQLYSVAKNALIALIIGLFIWHKKLKNVGMISGIFLFSYGLIRAFLAFFREPEAWVGSIPMGQFLSLCMVAFGLWRIVASGRNISLQKS